MEGEKCEVEQTTKIYLPSNDEECSKIIELGVRESIDEEHAVAVNEVLTSASNVVSVDTEETLILHPSEEPPAIGDEKMASVAGSANKIEKTAADLLSEDIRSDVPATPDTKKQEIEANDSLNPQEIEAPAQTEEHFSIAKTTTNDDNVNLLESEQKNMLSIQEVNSNLNPVELVVGSDAEVDNAQSETLLEASSERVTTETEEVEQFDSLEVLSPTEEPTQKPAATEDSLSEEKKSNAVEKREVKPEYELIATQVTDFQANSSDDEECLSSSTTSIIKRSFTSINLRGKFSMFNFFISLTSEDVYALLTNLLDYFLAFFLLTNVVTGGVFLLSQMNSGLLHYRCYKYNTDADFCFRRCYFIVYYYIAVNTTVYAIYQYIIRCL